MNLFQNIWVFREVILPALDVLLLSVVIYKGYQILVQTRAIQLVKGAVLIVSMYAVAYFLNLRTFVWILNLLAPSLVIGIAIIFQPELRKIFTRIGQGRFLKFSQGREAFPLDAIVSAAEVLAYRKRGALIVFVRRVGQKNIIETGTRINGEISSPLLLTIFSHDTALHDGAVIVEDGRLVSAGCFLPLSEQLDVRRSFGTRHRAALGLVEESDAVVLVVSEETGAISLAYDGNLFYDLVLEDVRRTLAEQLDVDDEDELVADEGAVAFEE
ncbi:MAG: TIGR00159 family protein [Spirochaetaceae bacterium]|nr:MAG: TIGR00159 family protein [Spirochaetaceae bacterium]